MMVLNWADQWNVKTVSMKVKMTAVLRVES